MTTAVPWRLLPDTARQEPDGSLSIGGCRIDDLARDHGTPMFVYDEAHLRARCAEAVAAFGRGRVIYASKAFLCRAMARLASEEGLRIDVATGGEMHVALAAGVPAADLVLHGNNKSVGELRHAVEVGVGRIVVDSFDELDRLDALHVETGAVPKVLLRITPGVNAHTHEYIATGQDDSKFGFTVSSGAASAAVERAARATSIELRGIHAHIGSQVFRVESFSAASTVVAGFVADHGLPELILGGGLGVAYVEDEVAPSITEWAAAVRSGVEALGLDAEVSVEPGRALVAQAAITVYEVGTIKALPGIRTYVAVDGGMSDNPRPVLYGSGYETFLPRAVTAERDLQVRVVGKHCESGDVLVRDGRVPSGIAVGDLLATPVTGAYGHSMGSNYNKVPRPPVVFVRDGLARVVVRRETFDDLLATDIG